MSEKREVACLIPFRQEGQRIYVFLQKRDEDAPRLPNYFGFFGGGIEAGEHPEDAVRREIQEELSYRPSIVAFLGRFEYPSVVLHMYYQAVEKDFVALDDIKEGQGNLCRWFNAEDITEEPLIIAHDREILKTFFHRIILQLNK